MRSQQHTVARLAGSGSSSQSFIAFLKGRVQIGDSEGTISSQGRARLLSCFIPLSPHCPVRGLSHSRFSCRRDSHGLFIQYSFPYSVRWMSTLPLILLLSPSLSLKVGLELLILLLPSGPGITGTHHLTQLFVFLLCIFTSRDSSVHYREWHFPYLLCCGVS